MNYSAQPISCLALPHSYATSPLLPAGLANSGPDKAAVSERPFQHDQSSARGLFPRPVGYSSDPRHLPDAFSVVLLRSLFSSRPIGYSTISTSTSRDPLRRHRSKPNQGVVMSSACAPRPLRPHFLPHPVHVPPEGRIDRTIKIICARTRPSYSALTCVHLFSTLQRPQYTPGTSLHLTLLSTSFHSSPYYPTR